MDEKKPLVKIYPDYYQCSNPACDSIYHTYNFWDKTFTCRDCSTESIVPDEALPKKKPRKRSK